MTNQTKITVNLQPLEDFKRQVGDTYRARVGILGSDSQRDDAEVDNVTLGIIHIFGSFTHNIPPRDFLFMPIQTHSKEILAAMTASSVKSALARGDIKRVFALLGAKAEEIVDDAFATSGFGQWAPNSKATIARKGSDKPLIDTGQLRRSITSDVVKKSDIVGANDIAGRF